MADVGRPRNIETPEIFWKLFQEYVIDLKEKESEWLKIQYVGKEGDKKEDPLKLPLTIEGFKRYCWDSGIGCVEQYFKNQDEAYTEFLPICSRVKNSIRENQILGGMLNVFNPSITQRLNNLNENIDHTTGGDKIQSSAPNIKVTIVKALEEDE